MSYILDALKKAEADRDPDTRTSLAFEQRERRRQRLLTYVVIAALLANALILIWVFLPEQWRPATTPVAATPQALPDGPPATTPAATAEPAPRTATQSAPPPPAVAGIPARPSPANAASATVVVPKTTAGETVIGPDAASFAIPATPQRLADLPPDVRRRFPQLNFSTHVYADEPDLRAIVVNGTRLMEGDRLGDVTVREITEDGAVFAFEGRLVSVPVLEDWN